MGEGVAKDQVEAVKWYRKAAEQNYADAQNNLGLRYANGEGVAKDPVEAVKWFRKAAEQNHAKAQYNWASPTPNGEGVAKDPGGGGEMVSSRKAAEQNLRQGSIRSGRLLRHMALAWRRGSGRGGQWFRKSRQTESRSGSIHIWALLRQGPRRGKDPVEAVKWYRKAAEQDFAPHKPIWLSATLRATAWRRIRWKR